MVRSVTPGLTDFIITRCAAIEAVEAFFSNSISPESFTSRSGIALILICFIMGGAINAIQVALYALAAHVFPTEIRGTGVGITITVGRVGNILASYVGIYALDHGISAYFATFGFGMILVFFAMLLVRNHIARIGLRVSEAMSRAPAEATKG